MLEIGAISARSSPLRYGVPGFRYSCPPILVLFCLIGSIESILKVLSTVLSKYSPSILNIPPEINVLVVRTLIVGVEF